MEFILSVSKGLRMTLRHSLDAGENEGGGLNGLNDLNVLNPVGFTVGHVGRKSAL